MADTEVWTRASAAAVADGDTGWLDTSAVDELSLDLTVSVITPATGAFQNVEFILERKEPDGAIYTDWQTQLDAAPHQVNLGVGNSLEINKPVGDQTRVSWKLHGGTATFAGGLLGR